MRLLVGGEPGARAGRACATARVPSPALHSVLELQSRGRAGPTDLRAPLLLVRPGILPNLSPFPPCWVESGLWSGAFRMALEPHRGADDSAERAERASRVGTRKAAATGAGQPGLLGMAWGEGHAPLALQTLVATLVAEATCWQGWTHSPLSFPVPKHRDLSQGVGTAHSLTYPAFSGPSNC